MTYRYDASLSPALDWAGKAERLSFEVPTLPLFVHERLSTQAILETLKAHRRDKQTSLFEFFGDPQHSIKEQVLGAYTYQDNWVNRMILGDALVVMNSLLRYESLGGQVQMIYMDPPYGVKFGSNFQPFVRRGSTPYQLVSLYPAGVNQTGLFPFVFKGKTYRPPSGNSPEENKSITRVSGAFCFEATIPTPIDWEEGDEGAGAVEAHGSFTDRMIEILRQSPVLRSGNTSAPFEAGEHGKIAAKVIDDRGNELLVVKELPGAKR